MPYKDLEKRRQACRDSARKHRERRCHYSIWQAMIARCYDKNASGYKSYGGRGISVCVRWRQSFQNFLDDLGFRPTPKHTLERHKTNGNYTPHNCCWATDAEQRRNRRSNVRLTYQGRTLTIADWSAVVGIGRSTLYARVRRGLTPAAILTTPPDPIKSANGTH